MTHLQHHSHHISPAKLNLSLLVYPPIETGYHPIYSIFQSITLADTLEITWTSQKKLTLTTHYDLPTTLIPEDTNILNKIYHAFQDRIPVGIAITLTKKIPIGGGLGGGSSNAGIFLSHLNHHFLHLSPQELITEAIQFGSDIPFFLYGNTALVTGIGQTITPLPNTPFQAYILIIPPLSILSKHIYETLDALDLTDTPNTQTETQLLTDYIGPNTLEKAVWTLYPEYKTMTDTLHAHNLPKGHLSGSGATLFIPYQDVSIAQQDFPKIQSLFPRCRTYLTTPYLS